MLPSGIVGSHHGIEFLALKERPIIRKRITEYSVTPSEGSREPITAVNAAAVGSMRKGCVTVDASSTLKPLGICSTCHGGGKRRGDVMGAPLNLLPPQDHYNR